MMFGIPERILAAVFGGLSAILLVVTAAIAIDAYGFLWIDGLDDKLEDCEVNRKELRADRDNLIAAQKEARRLNDEQVQRIEKEQEAITDEVQRDLTLRLERLRSELRSKAAPRNPGSPKASPDGKAPGGTVEEARMCLAPDELLRAAENEERHDQLITWVEKQLGVVR